MLPGVAPDKFRESILSEIRPLTRTYKNVDMQYVTVILLKTSTSTYIVQSSLVIVYTRASQNVSRHADEFENCVQVRYEKFEKGGGGTVLQPDFKSLPCLRVFVITIIGHTTISRTPLDE